MKYKKDKNSSPFEVHSIIGFNMKVPIMNLTITNEQPTIAYASGHIFTILDCENNRSEFILGHEHDITFIGAANAGKVLASSDENLINIWERRQEKKDGKLNAILSRTFAHPFVDEPILSTGLSVDGEYLVAASRKYIKLWILRNCNEKPDAFYELNDDFRAGSKIVFCRDKSQSSNFAVTTETNILFCRWNVQRTVLETHTPKSFPGIRHIQDSSYCSNYCKGVSIAKRSVIVWSDTSPSREIKRNLFKNRMEFQFEMKLGFYQLHTVTCCNGFIAISDSNGELKLYDENMKLCFLYDLFGQIVCSVSFIDRENEHCESQPGCKDDVSSMGTFFVSCTNGRMYKCNLNAKPVVICDSAPVFMTCFDLHPEKDFLCGGRRDGTVFMYDYSTSTYDKCLSLPLEIAKQMKSKPEHHTSTCVNYSSCGRYLAAGTSNGYVAILGTITFTLFQKPLKLADDNEAIEKVIFSKNNELMVYVDESCIIGLLHFETSAWKLIRKCRVHDSPIVFMSFRETPQEIGLVTISEDHKFADYTLRNGNSYVDLWMNHCTRVDFISVLKSCIMLKRNIIAFPDDCGGDDVYLTTDESFKFRVRSAESFDVLNTFAAPISENEPITMMCHVQRPKDNAVAFANKNIIGLQHLPIDGNPNKYLAMVGHSRKIVSMKVSHCNKYLFTIGEDDASVYIWKIKMFALLKQYESGGTSLKPFCNLIPGGVYGELFHQMIDLFFYIQIKTQKENAIETNEIKLIDGIPISEAVDFMRCIGYFPSESKIEYIMKEMKYYVNDTSDDPMITFENLVKLFVNYRPPFGYLKSEIYQTLVHLGYSYTMQSSDTEITRERLIEICTELGEDMNESDAAIFLNRLDGQSEIGGDDGDDGCDSDKFNNIRSVYSIPEFMKYILGVE